MRLTMTTCVVLSLLMLVWFGRGVWRYCEYHSIDLLWRGYCTKGVR